MRIESVRVETSGMATFVAAGGFSFSAPVSRFEAAGLSPLSFAEERETSDEEEQLIREVSEIWQARQKAIALCARAEQCEAGLRTKLASRGFSKNAVRSALEEMRSQGLVDDTRYARAWVSLRAAKRATGPYLLKAEMRARGLGDEAIRAACADFPVEEALRRAIKIESERLNRASPAESERKRRESLRRKLKSLGYQGDVIDVALDELGQQ